jgi:hypothetical protein
MEWGDHPMPVWGPPAKAVLLIQGIYPIISMFLIEN